jgi:hypothetical protein
MQRTKGPQGGAVPVLEGFAPLSDQHGADDPRVLLGSEDRSVAPLVCPSLFVLRRLGQEAAQLVALLNWRLTTSGSWFAEHSNPGAHDLDRSEGGDGLTGGAEINSEPVDLELWP